jgi:hypothetical protein
MSLCHIFQRLIIIVADMDFSLCVFANLLFFKSSFFLSR